MKFTFSEKFKSFLLGQLIIINIIVLKILSNKCQQAKTCLECIIRRYYFIDIEPY